uniref:Ion transport domain-containing protein n=1 Tax=Megaselia scalaris TaxID=36166 RepID=T1GWK6_MEGSC
MEFLQLVICLLIKLLHLMEELLTVQEPGAVRWEFLIIDLIPNFLKILLWMKRAMKNL